MYIDRGSIASVVRDEDVGGCGEIGVSSGGGICRICSSGKHCCVI